MTKEIPKKGSNDYITPSFLPNGHYYVSLRFYSDIDTAGCGVKYQYERYFRLNDEVF